MYNVAGVRRRRQQMKQFKPLIGSVPFSILRFHSLMGELLANSEWWKFENVDQVYIFVKLLSKNIFNLNRSLRLQLHI